MFYIICVIIGIIIGGLGIYFILRPKLETTQKINQQILDQNQEIQKENKKLTEDSVQLSNYKISLESRVEELKNSITNLEEQADKAATSLYEKSMSAMQERLANSAEKLSENYQTSEKLYQEEYFSLMEELSENFQKEIMNKQESLKLIEDKLIDISKKFSAAVEANKRTQAMEKQENFYRLQLSKDDLNEIHKLNEIAPFLRNQEPLNKVIWKVYYEKAYTDLIGRVIGKNQKTGIYKITNIQNKMCYVSQAVNVANRWKQHIKRGIGAETPTKNKLYPVMMEIGVENFTFELIEECSSSQLDEREKYWQEFFKAKEFGYSIK